ncbi:MAG: hypothetical protein M1434_13600 [Chloroflexi bacterium]|nr:hypothetical protein [Chloroflexota bacterium]MCL5275758.1 hypothetical protein [Chloroflexota bacterium]
MPRFQTIAFDADDTLWYTEDSYAEAEVWFLELMPGYHTPAWIAWRLFSKFVYSADISDRR